MKRVLLVQPNLHPPGGGNTVAAWIIEALKTDYSVSLLTWKPPDFEEVNRFYGTSLKKSDINVYFINPIIRGVINLIPDPTFQRANYLMSVCKRLKKGFDIIISAFDEVDFGCKVIQYIHYPYLHIHDPYMHEKVRLDIDSSWLKKLMRMFYSKFRPWVLISRFSFRRMKNNFTLVNSDWTGNKVKEYYGIDATTVYPPIPGKFPDISWKNRENGFVCIGRFCPGKRFEAIIGILAEVRLKIPDVHLHTIGTPSPFKGEREYYKQLIRVVQKNSPWVLLHQNLSREELIELISRHRYGIHANIDEHFGIVVGEMLKAGCIVFVHNSGGQVEIVGREERLLYRNKEEAIAKIVQVINNPEERDSLCHYLNSRKELFSTEKFMSQIQEILRQF
jgi:glycosyltransferase involved in cell wall biosynthesis